MLTTELLARPPEHQCGKVSLDNGVVSYPDSIVWVEQCRQGCCDRYHCTTCGRMFWIEWPD
jgi:hypothetical protein